MLHYRINDIIFLSLVARSFPRTLQVSFLKDLIALKRIRCFPVPQTFPLIQVEPCQAVSSDVKVWPYVLILHVLSSSITLRPVHYSSIINYSVTFVPSFNICQFCLFHNLEPHILPNASIALSYETDSFSTVLCLTSDSMSR